MVSVTSLPPTALQRASNEKYGIAESGQPHPGVETFDPAVNRKVYHRFYQWVGFVICIQVTIPRELLPP